MIDIPHTFLCPSPFHLWSEQAIIIATCIFMYHHYLPGWCGLKCFSVRLPCIQLISLIPCQNLCVVGNLLSGWYKGFRWSTLWKSVPLIDKNSHMHEVCIVCFIRTFVMEIKSLQLQAIIFFGLGNQHLVKSDTLSNMLDLPLAFMRWKTLLLVQCM